MDALGVPLFSGNFHINMCGFQSFLISIFDGQSTRPQVEPNPPSPSNTKTWPGQGQRQKPLRIDVPEAT